MKIELIEEVYKDQWFVRACVVKGDSVLQSERVLGPDLFVGPNEKMSTYYKNYARNEVTREVIEAYYSEE